MKKCLTANYILSLLSIKNGFDEMILKSMPGLSKAISNILDKVDYYIDHTDDYVETLDNKYIKITADVFEALIGAIYIDTNQDMGKTKQILRKIYGDLLEKLTQEEYIKTSAKWILEKYCEDHYWSRPILRQVDDDDNYAAFNYVLEIDGKEMAKITSYLHDMDIIEKKIYRRALHDIHARDKQKAEKKA